MLEQEGLSEIARSNTSEQIAYLLVERTALLEKLEAAAEQPDPRGRAAGLSAAQVPRLRCSGRRAGKRASLRCLLK